MEKVENIQGQVGNVSREIETLKKDEKKMTKIKHTITDMKNAFEGLISILDTVKERVSALKIGQYTLLKLKCKNEKIEQNLQQVRNDPRGVTCL